MRAWYYPELTVLAVNLSPPIRCRDVFECNLHYYIWYYLTSNINLLITFSSFHSFSTYSFLRFWSRSCWRMALQNLWLRQRKANRPSELFLVTWRLEMAMKICIGHPSKKPDPNNIQSDTKLAFRVEKDCKICPNGLIWSQRMFQISRKQRITHVKLCTIR